MAIQWYARATQTTIDKAGRIVVPKALRDELGFKPGQRLDLSIDEGRLEIEAPATPVRLEATEYGVVAVTDREMPTLTTELVRETLERVRR